VMYFATMPKFVYTHGREIVLELWNKETTTLPFLRIPIPDSLKDVNNVARIVLTLLLCCMLGHEPAWWCGTETFLDESCTGSEIERSNVFSMCTAFVFWTLTLNLAVFSPSLSAYLLVAGRMSVELVRFLSALFLLFFAFACGIAALDQEHRDFQGVGISMVTLAATTIGLYEPDYKGLAKSEPELLAGVLVFMALATIFLLNLLIAQFNCSYENIIKDSIGLARLRCSALITKNLEICAESRWRAFLDRLQLDKLLELNEGDLGPAAGIQVTEPSNQNSNADELDNVTRFGGPTSPDSPWGEDTSGSNQIEERIDGLEQICKRILRKFSDNKKGKKGAKGGDGSDMEGSEGEHSGSNGSGDGDE